MSLFQRNRPKTISIVFFSIQHKWEMFLKSVRPGFSFWQFTNIWTDHQRTVEKKSFMKLYIIFNSRKQLLCYKNYQLNNTSCIKLLQNPNPKHRQQYRTWNVHHEHHKIKESLVRVQFCLTCALWEYILKSNW